MKVKDCSKSSHPQHNNKVFVTTGCCAVLEFIFSFFNLNKLVYRLRTQKWSHGHCEISVVLIFEQLCFPLVLLKTYSVALTIMVYPFTFSNSSSPCSI